MIGAARFAALAAAIAGCGGAPPAAGPGGGDEVPDPSETAPASGDDATPRTWHPAFLIREGGEAWWPRVAMSDGRAVVTWGENNIGEHELWFRQYTGGAPVAEAARAARPLTLDDADVAGNARGDVTFLWHDYNERGVMASHYRVSRGAWTEPQLIGPGSSSTEQPHVAINARGDALAVWVQHAEPDELRARRWSADGGWGPAHVIHRADDVVETIAVGLDDRGIAVVAWCDHGGAARATHTDEAGWSAPEVIDPEPDQAWHVRWVSLDVAPSGAATLLWLVEEPRHDGVGLSSVAVLYASHRPPGGAWSARARVTPEDGARPTADGRLAARHDIDEYGTVRVQTAGSAAWAMWRNAADERMWVNRFAVDSGWSRARALPPSYLEDAALATNAHGAAVTAWVDSDDHLVVSRWDPVRERWGEPEPIGDALLPAADIALDDAGNVFVAWEDGSQVWGRYYGPATTR